MKKQIQITHKYLKYLIIILLFTSCGPSKTEKENIAISTCNIISETRVVESAKRLELIQEARKRIGEDIFLGTDEDIKEAVKYNLCKQLILNDKSYSDKLRVEQDLYFDLLEKNLRSLDSLNKVQEEEERLLRLEEEKKAEKRRLEERKKAEARRIEQAKKAQKEAEELAALNKKQIDDFNRLFIEKSNNYKAPYVFKFSSTFLGSIDMEIRWNDGWRSFDKTIFIEIGEFTLQQKLRPYSGKVRFGAGSSVYPKSIATKLLENGEIKSQIKSIYIIVEKVSSKSVYPDIKKDPFNWSEMTLASPIKVPINIDEIK